MECTYEDNFMQHIGFGDKVRTGLYIQALYMWKLVCPVTLSSKYATGSIHFNAIIHDVIL